MLHDNSTPLAAIGFEQLKPDGSPMAVIAARGSFEIVEGVIRYTPTQELVFADVFEGDPQRTPLVRVGDLIPFKPAADVTVLGVIQSPQAVAVLRAGLRVTGRGAVLEKHLLATGPRNWAHDGQWRLGASPMVDHVPLDWRLATGGRVIGDPDGTVDPRNPIGAGVIHRDYTSEKLTLPAAQIFSETAPFDATPTQPPPPEGMGPIAPWAASRSAQAGTYDQVWQDHHHPLLPLDFDYRFYQSAPEDLQVPGYLHPGDRVQAYGLLPDGALLDFHLPDLAPYATFSFNDGREVQAQLHLDGLHLDLRDGIRFGLTWRAWAPICPSFWRIDLHLGRSAEVAAMALPVSALEGLRMAG